MPPTVRLLLKLRIPVVVLLPGERVPEMVLAPAMVPLPPRVASAVTESAPLPVRLALARRRDPPHLLDARVKPPAPRLSAAWAWLPFWRMTATLLLKLREVIVRACPAGVLRNFPVSVPQLGV